MRRTIGAACLQGFGACLGALLFCAAAEAQTYSTNFDGSENPLSEGGAWKHDGLDWTKVRKVNGVAYGTQSGSGGYDDSYAYLSGFPADQQASAVIRRIAGGSGIHEVEILLRWSDSAHSATGYECLLSYDASYAQIVRWNGPLADFTYIGWAQQAPLPQTGDVVSATAVGDQITVYYNGVELMHATDSTYAEGNPGVGFYIQSTSSTSEMAFTSFSASAYGAVAAPEQVNPRPRLVLGGANPFRGETSLAYSLTAPGWVRLVLLDATGRVAAKLIDAPEAPGMHVYPLDAAALPGGVYFARFAAGDRAETIKLVKLP